MKLGYIYSIVSKIEGTVYIGSTTRNIVTRKNEHFEKLVKNKHENWKLQRIVTKYTIKDLELKLEIEYKFNNYTDLLKKEKEWISFIPEDYCLNVNRDPIQNNFYGRQHTEEAKEKNRQAHLGHTAWNLGVPMKQDSRLKNMYSNCSKEYVLYNLITLKKYFIINMEQFCRDFNLHSGYLIELVKGKRKTYKKWVGHYATNEESIQYREKLTQNVFWIEAND